MRYLFVKSVAVILLACTFLSACKNETKEKPAQAERVDSLTIPREVSASGLPFTKGFAGIFNIPEVLSLCKMDSADATHISGKIRENFGILDEDLRATGIQTVGPQGIIYYSNSPENFKFECLLLINKIPKQSPKHTRIVVQEADQMLLYNYFGAYDQTYKAYEEIKTFCSAHHLAQSGPLREFYPSEHIDDADTSAWLTRILIPVVTKK